MEEEMDLKKVILCMILSAAITLPCGYGEVFAAELPDAEEGSVSLADFDSDDLLMQYIDNKVAEKTASNEAASGGAAGIQSVNKRRDVLDPVAMNMYDALAPSVRKVAAGNLSDTAFVVSAPQVFESAKFDAEDLGVNSLLEEGSKNTITREAFDAFVSTLTNSLTGSLSDMLHAMICDMPYELYWFDNVNGVDFEFTPGWFEDNMKIYNDGGKIGIETDDTLKITFKFYVSQDYSQGGSAKKYGPAKTTKADTSLTKAAANTAKNISAIIQKAKDETDVNKLVLYKDEICRLTAYHPTAMEDDDFPYGDPWQLIYVFDGDENTKVVCEGYSKAFQYLCDNTSFADRSVESRLVSGNLTNNTGNGAAGGAHMWNVVHMDDGYNYIADVTNSDDDTVTDTKSYPSEVFLTGAVSGSVSNGYTFKYGNGSIKLEYDKDTLKLFPEKDLAVSVIDYPHEKGDDGGIKAPNTMNASGKTVRLKAGTLKNKCLTIAAKKAMSVSKAKGTVSYKLIRVSKKSAKKKFTVKTNGNITVKKGLKKGTYKLTVAVTAAGDINYAKSTKRITVIVKVI